MNTADTHFWSSLSYFETPREFPTIGSQFKGAVMIKIIINLRIQAWTALMKTTQSEPWKVPKIGQFRDCSFLLIYVGWNRNILPVVFESSTSYIHEKASELLTLNPHGRWWSKKFFIINLRIQAWTGKMKSLRSEPLPTLPPSLTKNLNKRRVLIIHVLRNLSTVPFRIDCAPIPVSNVNTSVDDEFWDQFLFT